jgi:hypothetical protein
MASVTEIESLIRGVDKIMPIVLLASQQAPERFIISDDSQFDGQLMSPEAFAVIRAGTLSTFAVDSEFMAIDGRKIREFVPAYRRIVEIFRDEIKSGESFVSAKFPIREFSDVPASESIDILSDARRALIGILPERNQAALTKSSSLVPWLLALGTVGLVIKAKG